MNIDSLLGVVLPSIHNTSIPQIGNDGHLYEWFDTSAFAQFFGVKPEIAKPSRISILEYLNSIGLSEWPDERFCLFLERIVNPEVQSLELQSQLVERLNKFLEGDVYD